MSYGCSKHSNTCILFNNLTLADEIDLIKKWLDDIKECCQEDPALRDGKRGEGGRGRGWGQRDEEGGYREGKNERGETREKSKGKGRRGTQ